MAEQTEPKLTGLEFSGNWIGTLVDLQTINGLLQSTFSRFKVVILQFGFVTIDLAV